jgi:hypothetical protein
MVQGWDDLATAEPFSYAEKGVNGKQVFTPNLGDPVETFFVGSEELYRKTTDPQGKIYKPCR